MLRARIAKRSGSPDVRVPPDLRQAAIGLALDSALGLREGRQLRSGLDLQRFAHVTPALGATVAPPVTSDCRRLADLSLTALDYAARLPAPDVAFVARRLYAYNRAPLTSNLAARIERQGDVQGAQAVNADPATATMIAGAWRQSQQRAASGWITWWPRETPSSRNHRYKVYASPTPEEAHDCVRTIVATLTTHGPVPLKVFATVAGLLRCDKIVCYLEDLDAVKRVARPLALATSDFKPQGVPFTESVSRGGLLSWGIDPPADQFSDGEAQSWRSWIVARLATSIRVARGSRSTAHEAVEFALARMRAAGIDPTRWAPPSTTWT